MTRPALLADASALQLMPRLVNADRATISTLLDTMTMAVEDARLCFPKEVADDLKLTAESEAIAYWVSGLGRKLRAFQADYSHMRPVMGYAKQLGFDSGFDTFDSKEPSIASVARLASQYQSDSKNFIVVTEDRGESPLLPTMEQLCSLGAWPYCGAREAIIELGLSSLLI